jgi:hypothetical protein
MSKNISRGLVVPFAFRGCPGERYFDISDGTVRFYVEIRGKNKEERETADIYVEMCKLLAGDPMVMDVFASFPPYGIPAWQAKVHAALDMVLETMNEGKLQTTLSPTLIKKRMRDYLEEEVTS